MNNLEWKNSEKTQIRISWCSLFLLATINFSPQEVMEAEMIVKKLGPGGTGVQNIDSLSLFH